MSSPRPRLSICIPAYCRVDYIERALTSINCQTFKDLEVIISDDSPDDAIEKCLSSVEKPYEFIYVRNYPPLGAPENWNSAIEMASGEYIQVLHHDDWLNEDASLAKLVEMMDSNPECNLAFCASANCNVSGSLSWLHRPSRRALKRLSANPVRKLFAGNCIGAPSAVIFRSIVGARFDKKLKWLSDVDFYISLLGPKQLFTYIDEPLVCITDESDGRLTAACKGNGMVEVAERVYLFEKLSGIPGFANPGIKPLLDVFAEYDVRSREALASFDVDIESSIRAVRLLKYVRMWQMLSSLRRAVRRFRKR